MTTFAQRLQMACSDHPDIPDYGKGLQTEIAKQMKVSQEAVRKWLSGESTPRQPAMIRLAKFLGVEYVWLALGTSETEFENMKQISAQHDGAVHALISFLILKGYNVAFSHDDTDRADIHAIGHGVQRNLAVVMMERTDDYEAKITTTMPDETISLIAVYAMHEERIDEIDPNFRCSLMYDFVWITSDLIKKHGNRSGIQWELKITWDVKKHQWIVGKTPLTLFLERNE
jgi:transcriptional regulator with XRE-family HTH domain